MAGFTNISTTATSEVFSAEESAIDESSNESSTVVTIIEPQSGWRLVDWREMFAYRDLFTFLVWRGIKVRYAQSAIGIGWALIQPVISMVVFTVIFGKLANISSDGVPYAIFSFTALVPWTYFSGAMTESTASLVANANLISKVYFPRLVLPLSAVIAKLLDFFYRHDSPLRLDGLVRHHAHFWNFHAAVTRPFDDDVSGRARNVAYCFGRTIS